MQPTNKPSWSILDRSHRWTPSAETNIRRLFSRVKFQQNEERRQRELETTNVQPIRGSK